MDTTEIDAAIAQILKCTADDGCPHEEACFVVAQWAQSIRASRQSAAESEPEPRHEEPTDWSAA